MIRLTLKDSIFGWYVNAPSSDPSQLLRDLIAGIDADPDCLIKQCHLYPLGGLSKSADWMYRVHDGNFHLSGAGLTTF